jgi:hypothetical protein
MLRFVIEILFPLLLFTGGAYVGSILERPQGVAIELLPRMLGALAGSRILR